MKKLIAFILFFFKHPGSSTSIDEDTITLGYGKLGALGHWQYPLPDFVIRYIYGTTSWEEWKQNPNL